jgi:hypothetical protein
MAHQFHNARRNWQFGISDKSKNTFELKVEKRCGLFGRGSLLEYWRWAQIAHSNQSYRVLTPQISALSASRNICHQQVCLNLS